MISLALACATTPAPVTTTPAPVTTPAPTPAVVPVAPEPAVISAPQVSGGTLTIRIAHGASFTAAEVICPSGYRQRAVFTNGTADLPDLPAEQCTLLFKGGPPAKFTPITAGTWQCSYSGSTLSCSAQ